MDFEKWEPLYLEIINRFGFSQEKDEKAALWLSERIKEIKGDTTQNGGFDDNRETSSVEPFQVLKSKIGRRSVVICGNAPSLEKEWNAYLKKQCLEKQCLEKQNSEMQCSEKQNQEDTIIAADGAAAVLLNRGRVPDIIMTDLDGRQPGDAILEIAAAGNGALLLIHAHGDNTALIQKYLLLLAEKIKNGTIIPTCQCRPPAELYNFGGFTDGDRCVFLAQAFGAEKITLLGFDFNDRNVTDLKKKKLVCAEKLIRRLSSDNPGKIRYFSDLPDI